MKDINQSDLMIIIEGAYQMAETDSRILDSETILLGKIMDAAGIDSSQLVNFENVNNVDLRVLGNRLSSETAKKLFLLTLAGTALADQSVHINEEEMMDVLAEELNVGTIRMEKISYANCEKMILKLISESTVIDQNLAQ